MKKLRDYQLRLVEAVLLILAPQGRVCMQLPTGAGKTAIIAAIIAELVHTTLDKRIWFVVPRLELIGQALSELKEAGIICGILNAQRKEHKRFSVCVVSKDTLIAQNQKGNTLFPDIMIFDECHVALEGQEKIVKKAPNMAVLGITATPERLPGNEKLAIADFYTDFIFGDQMGASISQLTESGYLSPLKYYAPPFGGKIKFKKNGDVDTETEENIRLIYGDVVEHYAKYGKGRKAIGFTTRIKEAYRLAAEFRDKGFNFQAIEGSMSINKRKELIDGLSLGDIEGLVSCQILTYGFDCPIVSYGFSVRPTLSRALYCQMIGRILRIYPNKDNALFFDHVNMWQRHILKDGRLIFHSDNIEWDINGRRNTSYEASCEQVQKVPPSDPDTEREEKETGVIGSDLVEITKDIESSIADKHKLLLQFETELKKGNVEMCTAIAHNLGYKSLYTYYRFSDYYDIDYKELAYILENIQAEYGYKKGWVWYKMQELSQNTEKIKRA